ncbi:hypothetical protein EI982_17105 [Haloplanus rallus]|jgi:hypothetical protein|uniref:Uncharacterized protein n=1 Tax=Haloplanus rallus TaxID=1816183 RepID=A0A6B9FC13_9EURY|nr:hypothetical protein [Haloplanus rallus]QGX96374.1 hypothetical protein EI982_17105 [Haloplanus rallus]
MSVTRRGLLAAAALAQSSILAGCFDGSNGTTADDGSNADGGSTAAATGTPEPTGTNATETATATATPVAHADLAGATADVVAEFEWFRTEYPAAIRGLRTRVNRVLGAIGDAETADEATQSHVTALREATTTVADYVRSSLVDHFVVDAALRRGDNVYVRDFERGVTRNDEELQRRALSSARVFYQRAISTEYVENAFSRRPIYGPLYDTLVPGGDDRVVALVSADDDFVTWSHPDRTESTAGDGIDRHTHEFPSGHRTYTHAHAHSPPHPIGDHENEPQYNELYAVGEDGTVALLEDTVDYRERLDDFEPVLTDLFGPVRSPSRTAGVTMLIDTVDAGFDAEPLYVERFASPEVARSAVASADDGPVTASGTATFAGRPWDRVLYEIDGTTVYAYRIRAGAAVVTALPSDVPWERRPEWAASLRGTWLDTPPADA